jgi:hypothetical protein
MELVSLMVTNPTQRNIPAYRNEAVNAAVWDPLGSDKTRWTAATSAALSPRGQGRESWNGPTMYDNVVRKQYEYNMPLLMRSQFILIELRLNAIHILVHALNDAWGL